MLLTSQLQTLKADILADPVLAAKPNSADGNAEIARLYNLVAAGPFFVWATNVLVGSIYDAITWASLTPNDPVPTDTQLNALIWQSRALMCQAKQFNLQILLQGLTTISGAKAKLRNGLMDALQNVPSGNNGTAKDAGWTAVQIVLTRSATRVEKLFSDKSAGNGAVVTTPATMVVEGAITGADVEASRAS